MTTNYISTLNNNKFSTYRSPETVVNTIVITYSVCDGDIDKTITRLHHGGASVHYTIGADGYLDQYHSEQMKTFHSGASSWRGKAGVNEYSIGIMLINDAKSPFSDAQIDKLSSLINDINTRHGTTMEVVGLGEVAPIRHIAPGKFFPWDKIGKSVNIPDNLDDNCILKIKDEGSEVTKLQENLVKLGYGLPVTGTYDDLTSKVVRVFTDHYAPKHISKLVSDLPQGEVDSIYYCWNDATQYALSSLLGTNTTEHLHDEM